MKKTIVRKDGATEVIEGTAEEIAEYERKLKGEPKKESVKKQPGLLKDERTFDLQKAVEDYLKEHPKDEQIFNPFVAPLLPIPQHDPFCEIEVAKRGWWCVVPPRCTCGLYAYPIPGGTVRYRYTYTPVPTTNGKLVVGDDPWPMYEVTCNGDSTKFTS